MIRSINKLGDHLLSRLLPTTTASAACWTEYCCNYKYCRTCCYHDSLGTVDCGGYNYC